jgi:hypothetical protein
MTRTIGSALKSLVFNRNQTFRRFFIVNVFPVDAVEEHHKQTVATPFPWRERPDYSHYNDIQFQRMESELKKFLSMDEFLRGAVASFQCAVNSIFSHPKLASHRITPSEKVKGQMIVADKEIRSEPLPFYNIFETFLSQFLEQSIYQFLEKNGNYKFCYELMKIRSTKIHAAEYLMYSSQLAKRYPYLIFDQTLGERISERRFIVPPTRSEDDDNCFENSEVLRVWVDFDCDGKFIVMMLLLAYS